ncbi:hypothetical protein F5887DRAFT_916919 [Amanita rubescens]|nr:hypothetical protein F5887DRAFT_918048 [Amanita rubescens]KAF8346245.1 hypothetical protein F5887DRAFT_916919 [Amanita rubescens]
MLTSSSTCVALAKTEIGRRKREECRRGGDGTSEMRRSVGRVAEAGGGVDKIVDDSNKESAVAMRGSVVVGSLGSGRRDVVAETTQRPPHSYGDSGWLVEGLGAEGMPAVMRRDAEGPFEHGMRRLNEYGYAILACVPRWNDAGVYKGADSVREAWDVAAEGSGECEKRNEGKERGLRVLMGKECGSAPIGERGASSCGHRAMECDAEVVHEADTCCSAVRADGSGRKPEAGSDVVAHVDELGTDAARLAVTNRRMRAGMS